MATTIAREAFQAFLDSQKEESYDFSALTDEQKLAEMKQYTELKIAAEKEEAAAEAEQLAAHEEFVAQRESAMKSVLADKGYTELASRDDFVSLFQKDKVKFQNGEENYFHGKDPEELADYYYGDGSNSLNKLYGLIMNYDKS